MELEDEMEFSSLFGSCSKKNMNSTNPSLIDLWGSAISCDTISDVKTLEGIIYGHVLSIPIPKQKCQLCQCYLRLNVRAYRFIELYLQKQTRSCSSFFHILTPKNHISPGLNQLRP